MDQRVEPPSWLPDGVAGLDAKGPVSHDSADDDLDSDDLDSDDLDSDGLDSQGPLTSGSTNHDLAGDDPASHGPVSYDPVSYDPGGGGLGAPESAKQSSAGDLPGRDLASDVDSYPYAGETPRSNGQDSMYGQDFKYGQDSKYGGSTSLSGYGQESTPLSTYGQESTPLSTYGQESTPLSTYGREGGLGGAASAPPYATQFADPPAAAQETSSASPRTAVFSAAPRKAKAGGSRGRRADLVLARLEPWSVMKFSFLISLVAWVILFVAVAVLWFALDALGVFTSIQKTLESVTSSSGSAGVSLTKWFSASRILGYTMLIGAVNIILITALSTVGSMIYNLVTHLGGGIEITLRESD